MFGHIRKSSDRECKERAGYRGSNPAHKVIILQSQEVSWQVKQSKATLFYIFIVLTWILGAVLQSLMEELFIYSLIHSACTQSPAMRLCYTVRNISADSVHLGCTYKRRVAPSQRSHLPPSPLAPLRYHISVTTSGDGPKRGSNQALKWQCEMGLCYLPEGKRGMEMNANVSLHKKSKSKGQIGYRHQTSHRCFQIYENVHPFRFLLFPV